MCGEVSRATSVPQATRSRGCKAAFTTLLANEIETDRDSSPQSTNNRSGGVPFTSSSSSSSSVASSSVFGLCTSVSNFRKLSRIGEGTYGYVYKACVIQSIDSASNNISETSADESKGIVALKRIKMHNEHQDGFPLTCLREIKTLRRCSGHENIVALLDIVVGRNRDAVFLLFEYCEHDLAALLKAWKKPFVESEIKCLSQQLLSAVEFCHRNWVVHRDIKLSNLLYNSRGQLKLADFGLARTLSHPVSDNLTWRVVTLWYRAPELLFGDPQAVAKAIGVTLTQKQQQDVALLQSQGRPTTTIDGAVGRKRARGEEGDADSRSLPVLSYSFAVDLWSVGCILGELLLGRPLLPGDDEKSQLIHIFRLLGCPTGKIWPALPLTPLAMTGLVDLAQERMKYPHNSLPDVFDEVQLSAEGLELLNQLLLYDPTVRITARDALRHRYFRVKPYPKETDLMPTFPSLHGGGGSEDAVSVSGTDAETSAQLSPSILLESVVNGDIEGVDRAIETGENIDLVNDNGYSAAMFTVISGDITMLRHLIEKGIDLNNPENNGVTPLMMAASQGDKELVEVLLEGNASPLAVSTDGSTAYSLALSSGRKLVALLIAEAAVLHSIESQNLTSVLENLQNGAYVNIRNVAGWTPLIYATSTGNKEAVKAIVDLGADCNRSENDGWTALHFAASAGYDEIVEILLKANINPGIKNVKGQVAKALAKELGHTKVVDLIPDVPETDEEL
eukprot:gene22347-30593_t